MFFGAKYSTLGKVPDFLMEEALADLQKFPPAAQPSATKSHEAFVDAQATKLWVEGEQIESAFHNLVMYMAARSYYKQVFNATLAWLPPGTMAHEHTDNRHYHSICDRYHVPLCTQAAGSLMQSRWFKEPELEDFYFQQGMLYRINNRIPHTAVNRTDNYRCHLIVDMLGEPQLIAYKEVVGAAQLMDYPTRFEREYLP